MIDRSWDCREAEPGLWRGSFEAMKSPCEVWLETDEASARRLTEWAAHEAWRVEEKYSRFRPDSVLSRLNANTGQWQALDEETASLLKFADQCWRITDGMIDITVGGFMKYWRFDGKTPPPPRKRLKAQARYVGWDKVRLEGDRLHLPDGVSLDLGGVGKEYAVDAIGLALGRELSSGGVMVNFGGDLIAIRPRSNQSPWVIGVEDIRNPERALRTIPLLTGAVATSGSSKRYAVDRRGKKLGHILNPKTGWPVAHGPASVTVVANTATQCGMLATYAMLKGKNADAFLREQGVRYFIQ